jgi:hypothetical protein
MKQKNNILIYLFFGIILLSLVPFLLLPKQSFSKQENRVLQEKPALKASEVSSGAFMEKADNYIAASGHYGNQSKVLVKNFAENLGFTYSSASTKEEFETLIPTFISPELSEKPILFEVFVSTHDEIQGDDIKEHAEPSGSKGVVKSIIGEKLYSSIKDIIHKNRKGGMTVDVGHN